MKSIVLATAVLLMAPGAQALELCDLFYGLADEGVKGTVTGKITEVWDPKEIDLEGGSEGDCAATISLAKDMPKACKVGKTATVSGVTAEDPIDDLFMTLEKATIKCE